MTVNQLIRELEQMDEDLKEYEVGVVFRIQLTDNVRLSGKSDSILVPENVDIGNKRIWLKAR